MGVDPIKLKAAEALMKYSERTSGSGGALSGDFLMPLVFFGMLMKDNAIPTNVKNQLKDMFLKFSTEDVPIPKRKKVVHRKLFCPLLQNIPIIVD